MFKKIIFLVLSVVVVLVVVSCSSAKVNPFPSKKQSDKMKTNVDKWKNIPNVKIVVPGIYIWNTTNWYKKAVKVLTNKGDIFEIIGKSKTNKKGHTEWIKIKYNNTNIGWVKNELIWFTHDNKTEFIAPFEKKNLFTYDTEKEDPKEYKFMKEHNEDLDFFGKRFTIGKVTDKNIMGVGFAPYHYLKYQTIGLGCHFSKPVKSFWAEYILTNETIKKEIYHIVMTNYDVMYEWYKKHNILKYLICKYLDGKKVKTFDGVNFDIDKKTISVLPNKGLIIKDSIPIVSFGAYKLPLPSTDTFRTKTSEELTGLLSFFLKLKISGHEYNFSLLKVPYKFISEKTNEK